MSLRICCVDDTEALWFNGEDGDSIEAEDDGLVIDCCIGDGNVPLEAEVVMELRLLEVCSGGLEADE